MKIDSSQMTQIKQFKEGSLSMMSLLIRAISVPLFFLAIVISSCQKDSTQSPLTIDKKYYPLVTGKYIIYDVDSTGYNSFDNSTKTSIYQIMEQVDTPYTDNTGNEAFKIVRSRRPDENSGWVITDIWSANLTDHTAEKVEENLRFIKLDFPIQLDRQWYGNAFIETDSPLEYLNDWVYEYTSVDRPLSINGNSFDSTLTVSQYDEENLIEQNVYMEQYAKHVGMIYKLEQRISTQPGAYPDGFKIVMQIKEHN